MLMDEGQPSRFVCKLCNKKFSCGKSLGGHMRSHVVANSAESEEKFEASIRKFSSLDNSVQESLMKDSSKLTEGYGLRENPKKTWRATHSRVPLIQESKICKQCGKGFQSLKALCGHMACHSEKDKGLKDDNSWTSDNQKMVMDSHSDTEANERRLRITRSSKSKRYKKTAEISPFQFTANNGSSSVSEIDGQEQEEVAMCLMLLSRDFGNKGGVNSIVESSETNSVVLETKSSSIELKISKMESLSYIHHRDETTKFSKKRFRKLKDSLLAAEVAEMENSDSDYFLDECAETESDEEYRSEVKKSFRGYNHGRTELSKSSKENEYNDDGMTSYFAGIESRKRKYGEDFENSRKRSKYECFNCKKIFKSYQALGGHRPCHKRTNTYSEFRYESGENSVDEDPADCIDNGNHVQPSSCMKSTAKNHLQKKTKVNKNKGHACPFCDRVFKNGQALGGHKRSHFIVGHDENRNKSPSVKPELPDLIDLNLPAPEVDAGGDHGQLFLGKLRINRGSLLFSNTSFLFLVFRKTAAISANSELTYCCLIRAASIWCLK